MPIQIHLSETEDEVSACVEEHGERPASYLDRCGLLGRERVLAHGCWLDRAELELIAERGATVVSNPVANLKLAVGRVFPYRDAREAGVEVGLGTDGPGSNNSLDLLADAKTFALLQKNEARDPGGGDGRRGARDRHRAALGAARRPRPRGRGPGRLPACASRRRRSSRSARSMPGSSTPRRARSSTRRSSRAGC